ncbi:MBL fold metallo-hydrolase [Fodinibius salsisoli]|uniref:MBL fold metallo-hydrolase n=1 Tax=Fodinibius salsisoli TaxID=2820877 RepID=A0ABT3PJL8_9BACT|nr:MBL fold metallo-hydrolase [Fodinibius salsisoli]MCW9705938.1 MBL fold metallo-hydrolase [Fodinibius salsisoli]
MHIGSLTIELLSEGRFELFQDGHINRSLKEESTEPALKNTAAQYTRVGINPILVTNGPYNILLDTGLGWGLDFASSYHEVSNVRTNLAIFKLTPADITHVILSHLHYDHAAGSSFTNSNAQTEVTFPNATYYLQQLEWEYALSQVDQQAQKQDADYQLDEFYRLMADNRIHLLKDEITSVMDGLSVIRTGGHTPGHQVVRLQSEGESAYYPGDLLPSSAHLNHYKMQHMDVDPIRAKKEKIQLLQKAYREQSILLFYHSKHGQSGRLIRDQDKQYVLADIPKD